MNAFDVRAVGWIVTRDALVDIVRAAFGASRRIRPCVLAALAQQWNAFESARRDERRSERARGTPSPGVLIAPAAPLSISTAEALDAVLRRMAGECPQWYGPAALWRRFCTSLVQAGIGFASASIVAPRSSPDTPSAYVALVMTLMGLWCLLAAVQLWRAYRLVKRVSEQRAPQDNAPPVESDVNLIPRRSRS